METVLGVASVEVLKQEYDLTEKELRVLIAAGALLYYWRCLASEAARDLRKHVHVHVHLHLHVHVDVHVHVQLISPDQSALKVSK